MIGTRPELYTHDARRLEQLGQVLNGSVSFEGEPIYADRPWGEYHDFGYGVIIPKLANPGSTTQRLDVLYDDFTTTSSIFTEAHFLGQITDRLVDIDKESPNLTVKTASERDMNDRAETWIDFLKSRNLTTEDDGITLFPVEGIVEPVPLLTRSGRPTCPVLDAVFQATKAEDGITTSVLVHSTEFRLQQSSMLAILTAVHDGELPFDTFVNVFTRQRKGKLRIANVNLTNRNGTVTEIN